MSSFFFFCEEGENVGALLASTFFTNPSLNKKGSSSSLFLSLFLFSASKSSHRSQRAPHIESDKSETPASLSLARSLQSPPSRFSNGRVVDVCSSLTFPSSLTPSSHLYPTSKHTLIGNSV